MKRSDAEWLVENLPTPKVMGMQTGTIRAGVRVTHVLSGVSVTCETERSMHHNRQKAMDEITAILAERSKRK